MTDTPIDPIPAPPRHVVGLTSVQVSLDLSNMPSLPTTFGKAQMIAENAEVQFAIDAEGTVRWQRLILSGSVPTKKGRPSMRTNSDRWVATNTWKGDTELPEHMPPAYADVIFTARHRLDRLMAGLPA